MHITFLEPEYNAQSYLPAMSASLSAFMQTVLLAFALRGEQAGDCSGS